MTLTNQRLLCRFVLALDLLSMPAQFGPIPANSFTTTWSLLVLFTPVPSSLRCGVSIVRLERIVMGCRFLNTWCEKPLGSRYRSALISARPYQQDVYPLDMDSSPSTPTVVLSHTEDARPDHYFLCPRIPYSSLPILLPSQSSFVASCSLLRWSPMQRNSDPDYYATHGPPALQGHRRRCLSLP